MGGASYSAFWYPLAVPTKVCNMSDNELQLTPPDDAKVLALRPPSGQTGNGRGLKFGELIPLGYPNLSLQYERNRVPTGPASRRRILNFAAP